MNTEFPSQDELLRAAGLDGIPAGPRRDYVANRIANDNEVLILADKLARESFLAAAVEQMEPSQRARLLKRVQPETMAAPPAPEAIRWVVAQATQTQQWHVSCIGPVRDFGEGVKRPSGEMSFFGTPERLKNWRPFGQPAPAEIQAEYARVYNGPLVTESKQGSVYGSMLRQPTPDYSKVPGPNYDPTRGPDPARQLKVLEV